MDTVARIDVTIHYTFGEIEIEAHVASGGDIPWLSQTVFDTRGNAAVIARLAVFFHHQIDDTGSAFGRVFGTRVGDEFNLFDTLGRHLAQDVGTVVAVQTRRLSVDPNLNIFAVAQRDITFLIHIYGRDIFQHLRHICTGGHHVLIHCEHFLVKFKTHSRALPDDFHFL